MWIRYIILISLSAVISLVAEQGYWSTFKDRQIAFDYVCGEFRDGKQWLYLICNDKRVANRRMAIRQALKQGKPGPAEVLFTSDLVKNFPARDQPKQAASIVNLSRTALYHHPGHGYVCLTSTFAGQRYQPGSHPLLPTLFSSPTGKPGTWTYHGRLRGEPMAMEQQRRIWSDNGGIVPLPDGRWRVYLNGYGPTLAAAEAGSLDGPWTFLKNTAGAIADQAAAYQPKNQQRRSAIFPFVLKVSDHEYHVWISQHWPVQAIWHLTSANGLDFKPYGQQPEITRAAIGAPMKGIRAFLSADKTTIHGWLPLSRQGRWQIHEATMPVGLQP